MARSAGVDDGASAGIGGCDGREDCPCAYRSLGRHLITSKTMPPPPRWALIGNRQPPLLSDGVNSRRGRRRVGGCSGRCWEAGLPVCPPISRPPFDQSKNNAAAIQPFAQFYHNNPLAEFTRSTVGTVEELDPGPCDTILAKGRE